MSTAEFLFGARDAADFETCASTLVVGDTSILELADVEIFYSLFELPMATSVARLPVSLHPSIPAVLGMSLWRVPQSPLGPFHLAYVGLACRTGIKPRHFVIGAWCDNAEAGEYLSAHYGFACRDARILLRESYERIIGRVDVGAHTILETVASSVVAIVGGGASVKYSPPLNLTALDGEPVLAQFEAGYAFKQVQRGVVAANVFEAASIGDAAVAPTTSIAGTYAVCDVQLLPLRFAVDLAIPAEHGGARKVAP